MNEALYTTMLFAVTPVVVAGSAFAILFILLLMEELIGNRWKK